jgi:hypothetical protein
MFSQTSRYYGLSTAMTTLPDGRTVTRVSRRFVPRPEDLTQIGEHEVVEGERTDHVAYQSYGDAEQGWRIADGNRGMDPDSLMQPGTRLRITLPSAISGGGVMGTTAGGSGGS